MDSMANSVRSVRGEGTAELAFAETTIPTAQIEVSGFARPLVGRMIMFGRARLLDVAC